MQLMRRREYLKEASISKTEHFFIIALLTDGARDKKLTEGFSQSGFVPQCLNMIRIRKSL